MAARGAMRVRPTGTKICELVVWGAAGLDRGSRASGWDERLMWGRGREPASPWMGLD